MLLIVYMSFIYTWKEINLAHQNNSPSGALFNVTFFVDHGSLFNIFCCLYLNSNSHCHNITETYFIIKDMLSIDRCSDAIRIQTAGTFSAKPFSSYVTIIC